MTCQECELLLASGEIPEEHMQGCAGCRAFQAELRANVQALSALREEILAPVKRRRRHPWIAAAAAAVVLAVLLHWGAGFSPRGASATHKSSQASQPLLVKMLTPDPSVVIYWLIDPTQEEQQ